MNSKFVSFSAMSLVLLVALLSGCMPSPSTDTVIKNMIKGGLDSKEEMLAGGGGMFSDYKVFRDGTEDGVVYEFIYADGVEVDLNMLTPENIKPDVVSGLKADKDSQVVFDMGIYSKMVYKDFSGKVLCEFKLTAADFK